MPLELLPTLDNLQVKEVEEHLKGVHTRRLLMQIEYKRAKNLKMQKDLNKIDAKLERQIEKFGTLLVKLIEIEEKCVNQQNVVQCLVNERNFTRDMMDEDE